jgi:tetratricopeptide (TPR) repeat protein/predicted aspartyl protease
MVARSGLGALALLSAVLASSGAAAATCTLGRLAELPVTFVGHSPVVTAEINGSDAHFLADSGAFYSFLTQASAAERGLKLGPAPLNLTVTGIGGEARVFVTTVRQFTIAGVPVPNVAFLVGGSEPGGDVDGVLGQNVLGLADTEYDLANGVIRLFRPKGCGGKALAYWAVGKPYSTLTIAAPGQMGLQASAVAFVNGVKVRVIFDTGAAASVLTLSAAQRAGITPQSPGVIAAGRSGGVGRRTVQTWIAPVASFKIGDEDVRNTRLRIGATDLPDGDMLLGADFFLSHRVYVAKSQDRLYFTYNGGPVFDLAAVPMAPAGAADTSGLSSKPAEGAGEPADAPAFARRGAAFAARRDFVRAIADFSRAAALDPKAPDYLYQRAMAYAGAREPFKAMEDLDAALVLKPDYLPALLARAELRLAGRDPGQAIADLDAADRAAPRQANLRLALALAYQRAGSLSKAIGQYDLWIEAHPDDNRRAEALTGRCMARGMAGQDLAKALADCDGALRTNARNLAALEARGFVRLRMGEFEKAIADFEAVLLVRPKAALPLYGRGVARLRLGMAAQGAADIAAATALRPTLPEEARRRGIAP